MRRDFLLFVKDLPSDLHTYSERHFFTRPNEAQKEVIQSIAIKSRCGDWFSNNPFSFVVIRIESETEGQELSRAIEAVSDFCGIYSLISPEKIPTISPLVFIREAEDESAEAVIFSTAGHCRFHSPDGSAEARWKDRNSKLVRHLLNLFIAVGPTGDSQSNEVAEQAKLAGRMYYHGCRAHGWGVEFLCKMSALEGIVCGATKTKKQEMLHTRIASLFKGEKDWKRLILDLYELRSRASHQSLAFSAGFVQAVGHADFLMAGVMTFVSEHLGKVATIDELWLLAPEFHLPAEAVQEQETFAGRVSCMTEKTHYFLQGFGPEVDALFQKIASGNVPPAD